MPAWWRPRPWPGRGLPTAGRASGKSGSRPRQARCSSSWACTFSPMRGGRPCRADLAWAGAVGHGRRVHGRGPGRPHRVRLPGTQGASQRRGHGGSPGYSPLLGGLRYGAGRVGGGRGGTGCAHVREGLATGTLLGAQLRRRVAGWLAAMSVSPVIGAAVTSAFTVPEAAGPVLVAVAAGVLAQAARVSLRAAPSPRVAHHPSTALPSRRGNHDGCHPHGAGRPRGRLSLCARYRLSFAGGASRVFVRARQGRPMSATKAAAHIDSSLFVVSRASGKVAASPLLFSGGCYPPRSLSGVTTFAVSIGIWLMAAPEFDKGTLARTLIGPCGQVRPARSAASLRAPAPCQIPALSSWREGGAGQGLPRVRGA